jgi:hypothetical protein
MRWQGRLRSEARQSPGVSFASSVQLARVASAGAVVGAAGIAMAIVMVAAATVREPTRIRS